VRNIEPGLPQLVSGLIAQSGVYREAILVAFLNEQELPELAVELPQRLARMLRGGTLRLDTAILLAGLTVAGVAATLTNTFGHAVQVVDTLILGKHATAFLFDSIALSFALSAFVLGGLRDFGPGLAWLAAPIAREAVVGMAIATLVAIMAGAPFMPPDVTLGRAIVASQLLLWSRGDRG
jgi:hypothetical protein